MAARKSRKQPVILSIAGHDPSSGAGITADIKTIAAHQCYGVTCVTALTVQSTRGVKSVQAVDARIIAEVLEELSADLPIAAVKIGMLASAAAVQAVAEFLKRYQPRHAVLDPVLRSSSGAELLSSEGLGVLKDQLMAAVSVITPNLDEATVLSGQRVAEVEEMGSAAMALRRLGARNVILTGGHLGTPTDDTPIDLISAEGSKRLVILRGTRVRTSSTHGTGCAFSTALACNLAQGRKLVKAAEAAKLYVEGLLRNAPGIGSGVGPVV